MSLREETDERLRMAIGRIPGVIKAHVSFEAEQPLEIHAIATGERTAEEVVQDIRSLVIAGFNIDLDRQQVSVVQLSAPQPAAPSAPLSAPIDVEVEPEARTIDLRTRPAIEKIFVAREGDTGWIRVTLRWPSGELTQGAARASERRLSRAKGAAEATLRALDKRAEEKGLILEIDQVAERDIAGRPSVLVHVFCEGGGKRLSLVGSAFIRDDVGSATVKALLNAVDRVV